jgi:hypothetical protein
MRGNMQDQLFTIDKDILDVINEVHKLSQAKKFNILSFILNEKSDWIHEKANEGVD